MSEKKASELFNEYLKEQQEWYKALLNGEKKFADEINENITELGLELLKVITVQEEELSILKRQVEEFKPAFILQQIRAGNVTEVENVDD